MTEWSIHYSLTISRYHLSYNNSAFNFVFGLLWFLGIARNIDVVLLLEENVHIDIVMVYLQRYTFCINVAHGPTKKSCYWFI